MTTPQDFTLFARDFAIILIFAAVTLAWAVSAFKALRD